MNVFDSVILGIVQGVTEFLPISSSGHLILAEDILGLDISSLKSFDVALHMGTLVAILAYFWKDLWKMLKAFLSLFVGKVHDRESVRMIGYILIGTIPAVIVGLLWGDKIDEVFRSTSLVAIMMIGGGFVFLLAEYVNKKVAVSRVGWRKALIIGLMQAVALIPGNSRSGMTISGGLLQGIKREEAARFSFLLGVPAIFGAGLLTYFDVVSVGDYFPFEVLPFIVGFGVSAIVGYFVIWGLMKFLKNHTLNVFAWYRFLAGVVVLASLML